MKFLSYLISIVALTILPPAFVAFFMADMIRKYNIIRDSWLSHR